MRKLEKWTKLKHGAMGNLNILEKWALKKMEQWQTIRCHMVPYGTTLWYHMIPPPLPSRGGSRRCWDAKTFSDVGPLKKSLNIYQTNHQHSSHINEF